MSEAEPKKKILAEFFKTETGNEPVREALKELGRPVSIEIGSDIRFVEFYWRVDKLDCDLKTGQLSG